MNSNVFTKPTEADVHQYLMASGYDDVVSDLRRENLLLKSENSRLLEHRSSMEQRIRGLNQEIFEYKQLFTQQRTENLSCRARDAAKIRRMWSWCEKLKKQNANLECLVLNRLSIDGDGVDQTYRLNQGLQSLDIRSLSSNNPTPDKVISNTVDTLGKRGPFSPSYKEERDSGVLLSPTFIMKELLGN